MIDQPPPRPNPYVGPRSFRTGETLYGRDREVGELLDLLIAERIVLLYSPSGAGKTSLVQAALVPRLREEDFYVSPPMRVNAELPVGIRTDGHQPNRFALSALLSLEAGLPPNKQMPLDDLARMQFVDYLLLRLWQIDPGEEQSEILVFDQFEEIITVDPANQAARAEFFAQIGQALRDKNRWALFSMREDFLAALDPYLRALPTRLSNRFRLDLLGESAARAALQEPIRLAGVDLRDAAARKLADDLRRVRVQRPDGSIEEQLGLYIEPVQLQVVGYRLWEHLPPNKAVVEESDVESVGDVDSVLAGYYADQVAAVARATGVSERAIRDWFDQHLITEQGLRGQVLFGGAQTEGLDNTAIRPLIDAHLVRAESRRGAIWFELSHDRLINPVRKNNAEWRDAHLNELQRRAALWDKQNRPDGLLLRGGELSTTEVWAAEHAGELTPVEHEFLAECRKLRDTVAREKRRNRLIARLFVGATIVSIIALVLFAVALAANDRANRESLLSKVQRLQAQAGQVLATQPQRSMLLALEALRLAQQSGDPLARQRAEDIVRRALVNIGGRVLSGHTAEVWVATFSPDNNWAVTAGLDGDARLWNLNFPNPSIAPVRLSGHQRAVRAIAVSPDSRWLVTGSDDTTARLWDLKAPDPATAYIILRGHSAEVRALAFSPDGRWLVTGSNDTTARIWNLPTVTHAGATEPDPAATSILLSGQAGSIGAVAVSNNGRWIATGGGRGDVRLWDMTDLKSVWRASPGAVFTDSIRLAGHTDTVTALAFSSDTHWLATVSQDATARLWDVSKWRANHQANNPPIVLYGNEEQVLDVGFSPNGRWLVTAGFDTTLRLWDMSVPDLANSTPRYVLRGHVEQVNDLVFSPDSRWLVSTGRDTTVRRWDLNASDPAQAPVVLLGHEKWIRAVAISRDGRWLLSASEDRTARLWGITIPDSDAAPIVLRGHTSLARTVAFSNDPEQHWFATGSGDGTVRLWDMTSDDPASNFRVLPGHNPPSIYQIAISPNGHWLASGAQDAMAQLWNLATISPNPNTLPTRFVLKGHTSVVRVVTFSPDNRWLATAGRDRLARLWDLNARNPSETAVIFAGHTGEIRVGAISPNNRWLVTSGDDDVPRLWDLSTLQTAGRLTPGATVTESLTLEGHVKSDTVAIRAVAFSPDNRWLATGGDDRNPILWDLASPLGSAAAVSYTLPGQDGVVRAMAFTSDTRWLITAGSNSTISLWDMRTIPPRPRTPMTGHIDEVRAIAVSPDNHWLLSGSEDGTARLWDLTAADPGARSIILPGHTQPVWAVAFSPDGEWMATGSGDATARLWKRVELDAVIALACERAGRNLSAGEWQEYIETTPQTKTCDNLPAGEGAP